VSEPTLRKYIRAQGVATKPRKKVALKTGNGDGKPAAPAASAETKPATPTRTHRFNLTVCPAKRRSTCRPVPVMPLASVQKPASRQ
jgi:hypothetical protein